MLTLAGAQPYRARAYWRGAQTIQALGSDLASLLQAGRLQSVAGIGPALERTIAQLWHTGTTETLQRLRARFPPAVIELSSVVSERQARALVAALGVATLSELRSACAAGRVQSIPGFGARSEQRLLARIDALAERPHRLLLPDALQHGETMAAELRALPSVARVAISGLSRRRSEAVDRIDLVVESSTPTAILEREQLLAGTVGISRRGGSPLVLRHATGIAVHVHAAPPTEFDVAQLLATGSPEHVAHVRARAAAAGYALTEHALERGGKRIALRSEADIYRRLGLQPIPPELREDAGEIEAAADGTLPASLLGIEDLRGVVHCHTTYSDGKASVEEMARGAEALGLEYLTITDHSATATYAGGLTLDRLRRQRDEIAEVQTRTTVRLLCGTESDILRDGALDYEDRALAELDVIIASVHNRYQLDAEQMTRRLVRAMRHPLFKIWGHALGRYVLSRPPIACQVEDVLDAIASSRAAIEINGDPHRLDLAPPWIRAARQRGIPFVISADAHSVRGMRNLRWGVDMARRGWLQARDVLNTLDADAFAAAVRPAA